MRVHLFQTLKEWTDKVKVAPIKSDNTLPMSYGTSPNSCTGHPNSAYVLFLKLFQEL